MTPIDFEVTGSKVKVTGAFFTIRLSAQMLKNAFPQCFEFYIFTFEAYYYVLIYSSYPPGKAA
jgi:hypothetical protein